MKTKLFYSIAILILIIVLVLSYLRKEKLFNNFEQSQGYLIKVLPGGVATGGIQFKFDDKRAKHKILMSRSVQCEKRVQKKLAEIITMKFPIVYYPSDSTNAEILLFKSQYEKYEIEIPKPLRGIVKELSECEK